MPVFNKRFGDTSKLQAGCMKSVQEEIVKELDAYQAIIDGAQKVVDNWKP